MSQQKSETNSLPGLKIHMQTLMGIPTPHPQNLCKQIND